MQSHSENPLPEMKIEHPPLPEMKIEHPPLPEMKIEHPRSPNPLKRSRETSLEGNSCDFEDDDRRSIENASKELVLYKPDEADSKTEPVPDTKEHTSVSFPSSTSHSSRSAPSIGAFTVQCSRCFKWRLLPTKEKYEEIRENILLDPFFCEKAEEWGRKVSCDDAPDISQDGSRLWAIDKPSIARPPPGWERLLRIRAEGGSKFADVYYVAPCGKRMRSMVEIQKYMSDHPEYLTQGVSFSQFSFQCPRPLQENYVKKRLPRLPASVNDSPVCLPAPINDSPARFPAPVDNSSYRLPELSVNDSHAHFPDPEIVEEANP
ncbi:methyl-CPG-binding domain protein 02 [Zostera marina]|uniref:Methyl-CPG-binding domain protein 02 n=1 Tax=Zostera marina TaxID=29655 RepID=A0A0K9NJ15_ZOSMR|nr:methyl-CPG-binding domain protein 02 [Zostera marina]